MRIDPKRYGGIGAGFGALVVFGATFDTNLVYLTVVGGLVGGLIGQAAEKFQKKTSETKDIKEKR
ncbi:MAG: hypothetical protein APF76_04140 [Desulfitibacter sp. BRH_c19]|nr:MAG: hypothetical protein APF76_04140 [Desulfitibacter sp. BRH_c19]